MDFLEPPLRSKLPAPRAARATVLADLQGTAQLATEATLGLTAVVEAMHARVASLPGLRGADKTRGITGRVYAAVRGITQLAGGGVAGTLKLLAPVLSPSLEPAKGNGKTSPAALAGTPVAAPEPSPARDAVLAALNGVLGDHLAATGNPLALQMTLRSHGRGEPLQPQALPGVGSSKRSGAGPSAAPEPGPRLLVLLHGLCMNHHQWLRDGHSHAAALAQAAGYTPVYLHYNSGLPIHVNGAAFALHMQALLQAWPQPLQRVVLLGHSMGGLVARSALHQGQAAGQAWVSRVDDAVFLGSPHHGAPLERAGNGLEGLLAAAPYAAPLARLARVRSAGITSLRQGNLLGDATAGAITPVPLPANVRCYAIAGTTGPATPNLKNRLVGDGLVPVSSALGQHTDPQRHLHFAPERQATLPHTHHMALLSSPQVAALLVRWLG